MAKRRRFDRALLVALECGHDAKVATCRSRVQASVAASIFGDRIRKGVWCFSCGANCQPTELKGVVRQ